MNAEDSFEQTVAALHRAALDDTHWLSAAARINDACGVTGHALVFGEGYAVHDLQLFVMRFYFGTERREDWEQTYVRDYLSRDERIRRLIGLPDGVLTHTSELFDERKRKTSAVYNELMRDMQAQDGLNIRLDAPAGSHIAWIFAESTQRGGWSSPDQIRMIERLRPHLRHFISVRHALIDASALGTSLYGLLDNTENCFFQLDRHGKVAAANDRAREVLQRREVLFAPGGFLRAARMEENVELQRLLADAIPTFGGQGTGGSMTIRGSTAFETWVVHVHPIRAELRDVHTRRVAAIVLAVCPRIPVWIDPDLLAQAFSLTRAESQLAATLAAGRSPSEIAAATGRKRGTIQWHLHQIFRKQGIARQAELVRRVLSLQPLSELRRREKDPPTGRR
ncbi:MAG: hypothetical protein F4Y74_06630 [Gemmatimonadales bacterium]|nr:hypothetical protein [Gemmatimonadales bacterium]